MPVPRQSSTWPSAGERNIRCALQYATPTTDGMGGRGEPTWTGFGLWWCKAIDAPSVSSETEAVSLYSLEGPYREDLVTYFTSGTGLRIVARGLTLKVFLIERPQLINRTLVAHCANAVNTQ